MNVIIITTISFYSVLWYVYLHKKTRIRLNYLYKDNLVNIALSCMIYLYLMECLYDSKVLTILVLLLLIPSMSVILTLLRFYRTPFRKMRATDDEIVSPADGNIIYITKIEKGDIPISIKKGVVAKLEEFTNTGLLDTPCWLIGINMTPFDVHKNCAPVDGDIVLNKHFNGEYLSLKHAEALIRNERNTIVINNKRGKVGVVQTASRLVRRIVTYKNVGDIVQKGDWFGMIKFGSQVDVILPIDCEILIELKQQVYAKKSVIAKWH